MYFIDGFKWIQFISTEKVKKYVTSYNNGKKYNLGYSFRSIIGDDVLFSSNISRATRTKRPLDPKKMEQIKELVFGKVTGDLYYNMFPKNRCLIRIMFQGIGSRGGQVGSRFWWGRIEGQLPKKILAISSRLCAAEIKGASNKQSPC